MIGCQKRIERGGRDAVVAGTATVNQSRLYAQEFGTLPKRDPVASVPWSPAAIIYSIGAYIFECGAAPMGYLFEKCCAIPRHSFGGQRKTRTLDEGARCLVRLKLTRKDCEATAMLQYVFRASHSWSRGTEAASQFSWPPASNSKNLSVRRSSHRCCEVPGTHPIGPVRVA